MEEQAHFILGGTNLRRNTWTFSGYLVLVYGEPAGRVKIRAALISVEEAARISSESVPNDGGDIKENDGSVSEGLALL